MLPFLPLFFCVLPPIKVLNPEVISLVSLVAGQWHGDFLRVLIEK